MRKYHLIIICLTIIAIMSITLSANSQGPSTTIQQSSLSYKAKPGDSNTYQVTKALYNNLNYIPNAGFQLENGTFMNFNITTNTKFSVKVVKINRTNTDIQQIYINQTLYLPGKGTFQSRTQPGAGVIDPAFDSQSSAEMYYNSSMGIFLLGFHHIKINGDFITVTTNTTFNSGNQINETTIITQEFNWKTGWLETTHINSVYSNGTIAEDYQVQRISSGIINSIVGFSTSPIGLGAGILSLSVIGVVGLAYSKYHGQISQGNIDVSFPKYLQEKVKFSNTRKTQKSQKVHSSEKALDMIDEILKENKVE